MEIVLIAVLLFVYFIPTSIAYSRGHKDAGGILIVNLFFGWTFLGWVIALAWSLSGAENAVGGETIRYAPAESASGDGGAAGEIERLLALRDKGALSEAEFARAKQKALSR